MASLDEHQLNQVRILVAEQIGEQERRLAARIEMLAGTLEAQMNRSIEQTREVVALGSELAAYLIEQKRGQGE